jgi:hypothetical protein
MDPGLRQVCAGMTIMPVRARNLITPSYRRIAPAAPGF